MLELICNESAEMKSDGFIVTLTIQHVRFKDNGTIGKSAFKQMTASKSELGGSNNNSTTNGGMY
jgi:hypothetical protein